MENMAVFGGPNYSLRPRAIYFLIVKRKMQYFFFFEYQFIVRLTHKKEIVDVYEVFLNLYHN